LVASELAPPALRGRKSKRGRYFFVGMAVFAVVLLALAFVPEFIKFRQGTFPIAPILHVHAAIMGAWVGAFSVQAYLGATGRIALHRQIGPYAFLIGWVALASMVFVEFRAMIVHPLPTDAAEYDWNLPGPYIYLTFPIFFAWAYHERLRPDWHKRLMTFAVFLTLLAAMQRYLWIPIDYGYGPFAATLDIALLVPLVAYDLVALRGRLHPATVRGGVLLLGTQALLFLLWGTVLWRNFAASVTHMLHS